MFRTIIVFASGVLAGVLMKKDSLGTFKDAAGKHAENIMDTAKTNAEKVRNVARKSAEAVREEFFPEKEKAPSDAETPPASETVSES